MFTETIHLFADKPHVTLTTYIAAPLEGLPYNKKRKAILVIPGGGYYECANREGEPMAHIFLAAGFNAFVLNYSTVTAGDPTWPNPLMDASAAMKYIRDHAEKFYIDPDYVFVIGSSAGGHLAASLGTLWDNDAIEKALGMEKGYNRPTGMILCYPVISGGVYAHKGSFDRILGENKDNEAARDALSLEKCVSEKTVPAFVWTTAADRGVPPQNSLLFAKALADAGVPFEMHIYPYGGHGASINNEIVGCHYPAVSAWTADCVRWMKSIDVKKDAEGGI